MKGFKACLCISHLILNVMKLFKLLFDTFEIILIPTHPPNGCISYTNKLEISRRFCVSITIDKQKKNFTTNIKTRSAL